ncbi:hypothetical protein [Nodularia sphaerocarpa]|uniref:hypothetical protein n=1 Tax=Nodularia sphaerocarpa TaxID=137816 RepID=UPI001EFB43FD|nr:hypothetical protein [Nodularia sphaerocarpa]MDB9371819.1 hypothetical protein [Nodularia sphaerocarpa CS-585]MDB9377787.1 hypothetical protein [Nodularia sphaerocarpa CS-585A2]ULP72310.1 hypothetical protein BDGGKGIB_01949 [Nodularia sphaerocarpa UHCC 0038]
MKFYSQSLAFLTYSWGLLTISVAVSLPAQASIVCEPGTIINHTNNSLAACVLGQEMTVQVSSANAGTSNFDCRAKSYISFDDKGQFQSCQLAQEIEIKQGNSLTKCPEDYRVSVSALTNGNLSINCSPE